MIQSFRHKGLKRLFGEDDCRRVQAGQADRISRILAVLNRANGPEDMALPGCRLHLLKSGLSGFCAMSVFGNWRIIWRFEEPDAADVDLIDYH